MGREGGGEEGRKDLHPTTLQISILSRNKTTTITTTKNKQTNKNPTKNNKTNSQTYLLVTVQTLPEQMLLRNPPLTYRLITKLILQSCRKGSPRSNTAYCSHQQTRPYCSHHCSHQQTPPLLQSPLQSPTNAALTAVTTAVTNKRRPYCGHQQPQSAITAQLTRRNRHAAVYTFPEAPSDNSRVSRSSPLRSV